jgi:hypothetical protein
LMWLLAAVVTLFALARTKFPVGNSPLTQIHFGGMLACGFGFSLLPL